MVIDNWFIQSPGLESASSFPNSFQDNFTKCFCEVHQNHRKTNFTFSTIPVSDEGGRRSGGNCLSLLRHVPGSISGLPSLLPSCWGRFTLHRAVSHMLLSLPWRKQGEVGKGGGSFLLGFSFNRFNLKVG